MKNYSRRISPHFYEHEFACKCCGQTGDKKQLQILVARLEMLRSKFNKPIKVISGYRCPSHNTSVKGAKRSQHMLSQAADIVIKDVDPKRVGKLAHGIFNGIGIYDHFTHVDTRAKRAFWDHSTKEEKKDGSNKSDPKPRTKRKVRKETSKSDEKVQQKPKTASRNSTRKKAKESKEG